MTADDPREIAVALAVAAARLTRAVTSHDAGEPAAVWRALSILEQYGPMRVGDFALIDRCTQPTATAMLQRLVSEGAARRAEDVSDRRVVLTELTPAGRTRLAVLRRGLSDRLGPAVAELSDDERHRLAEAARLIARLVPDVKA